MQGKAQLQKQLCQHQGGRAAHMATAMGTNGTVEKYWHQLILERLTPKIMRQALAISDVKLEQAPKLKMLHRLRERETRQARVLIVFMSFVVLKLFIVASKHHNMELFHSVSRILR